MTILMMPDEILVKVFLDLPVRDLISVGQCSQRFYAITQDEYLWKALFENVFKNQIPYSLIELNFKDKYKHQFILRKNILNSVYLHESHGTIPFRIQPLFKEGRIIGDQVSVYSIDEILEVHDHSTNIPFIIRKGGYYPFRFLKKYKDWVIGIGHDYLGIANLTSKSMRIFRDLPINTPYIHQGALKGNIYFKDEMLIYNIQSQVLNIDLSTLEIRSYELSQADRILGIYENEIVTMHYFKKFITIGTRKLNIFPTTIPTCHLIVGDFIIFVHREGILEWRHLKNPLLNATQKLVNPNALKVSYKNDRVKIKFANASETFNYLVSELELKDYYRTILGEMIKDLKLAHKDHELTLQRLYPYIDTHSVIYSEVFETIAHPEKLKKIPPPYQRVPEFEEILRTINAQARTVELIMERKYEFPKRFYSLFPEGMLSLEKYCTQLEELSTEHFSPATLNMDSAAPTS